MHINEKKSYLFKALRFAEGIFTVFFWIIAVFGFDEPYIAGITLISAAIHECGHIICVFLTRGVGAVPRGRIFGLRIRAQKILGYGESIMLYAAGAAANLLPALVALLFSPLSEYGTAFVVINVMSAISNLIPVEGYDGYGIITSVLDFFGAGATAYRLLSFVSFAFSAVMTFSSLYFIYRIGDGYWIFAVFLVALTKRCSKWLSEVKTE